VRETGRAVTGARLVVELVRELVKDQVSAALEVLNAPHDVVPREHDRPTGPRLAETDLCPFHHGPPGERPAHGRHVRVRVDDDRLQLRIDVGLSPEEEDARLRGDRDPDLVGDPKAPRPFEVLLVQEDADEIEKLLPVFGREALVIGDVPLDGLKPAGRERLL
jgi:hypothetical protein